MIAELAQFDPDTPVVVTGYESGYDDPIVHPRYVVLDDGEDAEWYLGRHRDVERGDEDWPQARRVVGVLRPRDW